MFGATLPHPLYSCERRTRITACARPAVSGSSARGLSESTGDYVALVGNAVRHGDAVHVSRTVVTKIGEPGQFFVGQGLLRKRLQMSNVTGLDANAFAHPLTE